MKKPLKILVIDDDRTLLLGLAETLRREGWYQVMTADNGDRGIQLAEKSLPNLIICDVIMPPPDGMSVLKALSKNPLTASIPFIFLTARTDQKDKLNGMDLGADDYITKPFSKDELLTRIRALLRRKEITESMERLNAEGEINLLRTELREIMEKYAANHDELAEAMAQALFLRDEETEKHSRRGVELTLQLARELGLNEDIQQQIRLGVLLHDIGKIGIPDSILLKKDSPTDEERDIMMTHVSMGKAILQPLGLPSPVLDITYHHHERWDGSGYPDGLAGEEIPLSARVFTVVHVWDTLTRSQPHHDAAAYERGVNYIREQAGKHFDPVIAEKFLALIEREREKGGAFN